MFISTSSTQTDSQNISQKNEHRLESCCKGVISYERINTTVLKSIHTVVIMWLLVHNLNDEFVSDSCSNE